MTKALQIIAGGLAQRCSLGTSSAELRTATLFHGFRGRCWRRFDGECDSRGESIGHADGETHRRAGGTPDQDAWWNWSNSANSTREVEPRKGPANGRSTFFSCFLDCLDVLPISTLGVDLPVARVAKSANLIWSFFGPQRRKAFQAHVPLVKAVRMMLDRSTRKSKGFCFVSFYSVSDAMTARNRMVAAGILVGQGVGHNVAQSIVLWPFNITHNRGSRLVEASCSPTSQRHRNQIPG